MSFAFLISFAVYFSVQLCLACFLLFVDIRAYRTPNSHFHGRVYYLEKTLIIIFSVLQISLLIASLVGIVVTFRFGRDMYDWIEAGVISSLQLGTGISLARLLQICQYPRWNVWLTYVVAFLTISTDILMSIADVNRCVSKLPVLFALFAASVSYAWVSYSQLRNHKSSGRQYTDKEITGLFNMLVITHVSAAAVQLGGAFCLTFAALGKNSFRVQASQGVIAACTFTQVFCCLPVCSASAKGYFVRVRTSLRSSSSSISTGYSMESGFLGQSRV